MANGYYRGKGGNVYNSKGQIARAFTPSSKRRGKKMNEKYATKESAGTPF
jgi:hypothetical protein